MRRRWAPISLRRRRAIETGIIPNHSGPSGFRRKVADRVGVVHRPSHAERHLSWRVGVAIGLIQLLIGNGIQADAPDLCEALESAPRLVEILSTEWREVGWGRDR